MWTRDPEAEILPACRELDENVLAAGERYDPTGMAAGQPLVSR
jgi:hypothetical protein